MKTMVDGVNTVAGIKLSGMKPASLLTGLMIHDSLKCAGTGCLATAIGGIAPIIMDGVCECVYCLAQVRFSSALGLKSLFEAAF